MNKSQLIEQFTSDKIAEYKYECSQKIDNVRSLILSDADMQLLKTEVIEPIVKLFSDGLVSLKERYADGLNLSVRGGKLYVSFFPRNGMNVWREENNVWVGYESEVKLKESDGDVGTVIRTLESVDRSIVSLQNEQTDEFMWFYIRQKLHPIGIPLEYLEWAGFMSY